MLSSSRERPARRGGLVGFAVAAAMAGTSAGAAQIFYQPTVTLSTAYNTNANLETSGAQGAEGYFADAATTIGIATPQSETTLQPRLLYNYYPSVANRNRLEGFLNMNTRYSWQRDRFNLVGFFDHRDDVNAEQPGAVDNPVNPGVGDQGTTGRTAVGIVRNYLILDPTFTHLLTPLSSIGVAAEYQGMRYSPDDTTTHLDFNYYKARLFYAKTLDRRTDISVGAIADYYDSLSIDSHSHSVGAQASGGFNWSETLRSSLTLGYQQTKFDETDPRVLHETSNPWSAQFTTVYKQQTSSYSFSLGRSIYPSSAGGLYTSDLVRGQYEREFTQRLHFTGALRFQRDRTTAGVISNNTRNYGTGSLRMQYMLAQTMFVAGAYTYVYQKYRSDPTSAQGHIVQLSFGYTGLQRQR